jgi:hypothetical protein
MKFDEVVNALIAGKHVRRASWQRVGGYISCNYEGMTMHVGGVTTMFSLNTLCLLADDWELVSDKESAE